MFCTILSVIYVFVLGILLGFYTFFCFLCLVVYFFYAFILVRGGKKKVGVHLYMLKCNYVLQASEDDDIVMLALIERSLPASKSE